MPDGPENFVFEDAQTMVGMVEKQEKVKLVGCYLLFENNN